MKEYLFLAILLANCVVGYSQITIGSSDAPLPGALLDLKEEGVTTKGLGMPRVALTSKTGDLAKTMGYTGGKIGSLSAEEHIGLIVYNVNTSMELCPGLYVWDGTSWVELSPPEDKTAYDPVSQILTDHEGNTYTTRSFGQAGRWMTENLRTRSYYPCYILPESGGNGYDQPTVGIPQNIGANEARIRANGLFYNWAAATKMKGGITGKGNPINEGGIDHEKVQGICPRGWHLPSDLEFTELENEIILHTSLYSSTPNIVSPILPATGVTDRRGTIHGNAMKLPSEPFDPGCEGTSFDALNNGFAVLLVGCGWWDTTSASYTSQSQGTLGAFWTSSSSGSSGGAYDRACSNGWANVMRGAGTRPTQFSVRCKQD